MKMMNDSQHNKTKWPTFKQLSAYIQVMAVLGWHQQCCIYHMKTGAFPHCGCHFVTYRSNSNCLSAVCSWYDVENINSDVLHCEPPCLKIYWIHCKELNTSKAMFFITVLRRFLLFEYLHFMRRRYYISEEHLCSFNLIKRLSDAFTCQILEIYILNINNFIKHGFYSWSK